jgi:LPXTG-motif cell wall-anchored protein
MRRRRHRVAAVLAAALLALPGAAWAQSAGDDQYEDPFAPSPGQTDEGGSGSGSDSGADEPAAQPDPAPAAPEPAAPEPAATSAQSPNGGEQLPRTGADEGLVALAGAVMLAGGIALRVRTR